MQTIDVFTGCADGLCALHQFRMVYLTDSVLITGVKRDSRILDQVHARFGDNLTLMNVSLEQNQDALRYLLTLGVDVTYFDHHHCGALIKHKGLRAIVGNDPATCTSALVDRSLGGRHRIWAVVAAFGANRYTLAVRLARPLRLSAGQLEALSELGQCLSYNAYGERESDFFVHPAELYRIIAPYADPLRLLVKERIFEELKTLRREELERALETAPSFVSGNVSEYVLRDAAGSRRVRGELVSCLAKRHPEGAYAVLVPNARGGYAVSLRVPVTTKRGLDVFCRWFGSGEGSAAAAGMSNLPASDMPYFTRAFAAEYGDIRVASVALR